MTGASSNATSRGTLRAADDEQLSARGRTRAAAQCGETISRSAADRAERARHAGPVRRSQPRDRRRISERRAPVRRASQREHRRRRDADGVGAARGHSRRRGVQHAAAADAVRHRRSRRAREMRHPRARAAEGCRTQPAGSLRGRRRQPDEEAVGRVERRHVHHRRSAVSRLGEPAQRHLCHQRFFALCDPALRGRQAGARSLLLCLACRLSRLPARILGGPCVNTTTI